MSVSILEYLYPLWTQIKSSKYLKIHLSQAKKWTECLMRLLFYASNRFLTCQWSSQWKFRFHSQSNSMVICDVFAKHIFIRTLFSIYEQGSMETWNSHFSMGKVSFNILRSPRTGHLEFLKKIQLSHRSAIWTTRNALSL